MRVFPISTFSPDSNRAADVACTAQAPDLHSIARHPDSYLRVVKPQYQEPGLKPGTEEFLEASVQNFNILVKSGALQPHEPAFWYYRQTLHDGSNFEGWILGIAAKDYEEGKIKKHENTIRDKEARLARHIGELKSVAEPVLLAANLPDRLSELANLLQQMDPSLSFEDPIMRRHTLWQINDPKHWAEIRESFEGIQALYIADGHHRTAATCLHIRNSGLNPIENGVMALVLDKSNLRIKSFHRLIHIQAPAWKLEETCRIKGWETIRLQDETNRPEKGTIIAYSQEGSYQLRPLLTDKVRNEAAALDVARLEDEIFPALFGIENSRVDSRISFIRGDTPENTLQHILKEGKAGWIFAVAANNMDDIQKVADAGLVMPPKSTWVEPKLMTGMLVMRFQ